jgi:hypothetical protein
LSLQPDFHLAHYLRADLRIQTPERNHVATLENLIAAGPRDRAGEVLLRFALAKEYEDLGADAAAFAQVAAGGALHRRLNPYDVKTEIAAIDRAIAQQSAAWLRAAPKGFEAVRPIFIIGLPRTGTTVIERIIASHGAVVSAGETGLFAAEAGRPGMPPDPAALGRRYVAAVEALAETGGKRFIDKTLTNYLHCGLIHAALPNAKILLVRRHPLDTGWALLKAHFQGRFGFSYDQSDLAEYYLGFDRLARHWRAVLPETALMEIRYEDVIRDQRGASAALFDFLDLPWEDGVMRFHESASPAATASAAQIRRPLYATSVGKWRRHEAALSPLATRLARDLPAADLA